jgi:hypothetical protein
LNRTGFAKISGVEERVEVVADGGAMLTAVWEDPYTLQRRTVNLPARAFDPD